MDTPALLKARDFAKRYGDVEVLAGVGFDLGRREILGVIGPNGSGKTTLMECLVGLLPAEGGEAWVECVPLPAARRREAMFYMPDGIVPWNDQLVWRVVGLFREMHRLELAREVSVIARLELSPVLGKRVSELSKGYRRRVLLALGLLTPQPILILDEPFDGFDLRQTLRVMNLLRDVASERSLILSIHQLKDAQRICDRLLLLDAGRRVGFGTLAELAAQAGAPDGDLEEVFLGLTR